MSDDYIYGSIDDLPDEDVLGRPPSWPNGLFRFRVSSVTSKDDWNNENTPEDHTMVRVSLTYSGDFTDFEGRRFFQTYILPNEEDDAKHWSRNQMVDLMRFVRACGLSDWNPKNHGSWDEARNALAELAEETAELELVLHLTRNIPQSQDKRDRFGDGEGYVNRVRKYWTVDAEEVLS